MESISFLQQHYWIINYIARSAIINKPPGTTTLKSFSNFKCLLRFNMQLVPNAFSLSITGQSHLISSSSSSSNNVTLFLHVYSRSNLRLRSLQLSWGPILSFAVETNLFCVKLPQIANYLLLSLNLGNA